MRMEKERALVTEYSRKMSSMGLSHGTSGNISIFDPQTGLVAITPSGISYSELTPERIVVINLDGAVIEGNCKPSSESGLHLGFYQTNPAGNCNAVVHTHSNFATTLACMGEPIRAVHYAIAACGSHQVPLCEYTTFGTPQLAEKALAACNGGRAVLLANHGLVTTGANLPEAFRLACTLENVAKLQWQCLCAGRMNVLTEAQVQAAIERFRTYGQSGPSERDSIGY